MRTQKGPWSSEIRKSWGITSSAGKRRMKGLLLYFGLVMSVGTCAHVQGEGREENVQSAENRPWQLAPSDQGC